MKRVFVKSALRLFWEKHPEAEQHMKIWYETVSIADWTSPADVKRTFANASILKDGRVVFNVKGNTYRIVVRINFEKQWVFIRFIGTHQEYDKIDANLI